MRFAFTAIDPTGRERSGVLEAPDPDRAAAQVKDRGLFALRIDPAAEPPLAAKPAKSAPRARSSQPFVIGRPVSAAGLAVFTRQLATLVQAGLPLLRALRVLERQEPTPAFRWVLGRLVETVNAGGNLSDGLRGHPRVFDRLYVSMVQAAEAGGKLGVVLQQLARFMEKAERIKGKVRSAMFYPVTVVVITVAILSALLVFVVPKFKAIFADVLKGAPLPPLTSLVLVASDFVRGHALLLAGLLGAAVVAVKLMMATRPGARGADWLRLHLPLVGTLFLKAAIARFARTLGTLMTSGVPILQALLITRETCGSLLLEEVVTATHDRVKAGESLAAPLAAARLFPPMVSSMVEVGEETGALAEMLVRMADIYDDEVDNAVAGLTSLIEPVMIVFLALVVGTVVIALFLPIVRILQMMG